MKGKKSNKIYIAKSKIEKAGRGVFAAEAIRKNEVIEVAPVIIIDHADDTLLTTTILQHYLFEHTPKTSLMALGYGSLYNHSLVPNAKYEIEENEVDSKIDGVLYFTATKAIGKGEEIYINYGKYYDDVYGGQA
jgi:SET domain-containing protein